MNVTNEATIYEINGKDTGYERPVIRIKSHWNCDWLVVIEYQDISLTVKSSDLHRAITNAENWK